MYIRERYLPFSFSLSKFNQHAVHAFLVVGIVLVLVGCKKSSSSTDAEVCTTCTIDSSKITTATAVGSTEAGYNADDLVENTTFSSVVTINFGTTVTVSNPLSASGVTITQSNGDVTINASAAGVEYQLSGTTTNGSVKIYSANNFKLTLNGVSITNADGPGINIQSSKKAFIVFADNSLNTLADGTTYATSTEDMRGTLFSVGPMIFSGGGTLNVKGNYNHAIVSDDYIRIRTGTFYIENAVKDAIDATNSIIADGGYLILTAQNDGIESEKGHIIINSGTFNINPVNDGISASYTGTDASVKPYVNINNGSFTVKTVSGQAITSKSNDLTINNGTILATTVGDGLYGGTAININSGTIYSYSTANDAINSSGTLSVTGGEVLAVGARLPKAGIHATGAFAITGGLVLGIGGSTTLPTASVSTVHSVVTGGNGTAEVLEDIEAADGTEALTYLPPITYNTLLFANAKLKASTTYNVYFAGTATGKTFYGYYLSGTYYKAYTKSASFTTSSMVTQIGGSIASN